MVTLFQHSFYKSKFVTMSVMLTYFMLQIGFTKINFDRVSFALIFNGLKIGKVF